MSQREPARHAGPGALHAAAVTCASNPVPGPAFPGVVVAVVRARTPAARAGLRPGDRIVAVNGRGLRDAIDFHYHAGEERLQITVDRGGRPRTVVLWRRGSGVGLELEAPRPSEISTCANKCVFCFIHQLPRGMRKSLYVKDDDFRLSFLHGNYITLTDLDEAELDRIEQQRLSPLYVSVHATDPALRHRLLGQPRIKRDLLPIMERLCRAGITLHAQIVLCPEWNDGSHLDRSVHDLARLHPGVRTTAVVPVGLTRHRERLPALRRVTDGEAEGLIGSIVAWQHEFLASFGSRFVFAADELYLQAGVDVPAAREYEGFAIVEDGVGLVRRFDDGFTRAVTRLPARLDRPRAVTIVTGEMFAPRLRALLDAVRVDHLAVTVAPIANEWFGRDIGVAGLLTGQDIQSQLAGRALGDEVLVPAVALRDGSGVFLDDVTPGDLTTILGTRVSAVEPTAPALLRAILGR
jgi:putative radical SAM enzyme (TIGR03279 family)